MRKFLFIPLLFLILNAQAATYTSAQNGDFSDPNSWNEDGAPSYGDDIFIRENHVITLSATGNVTLTGSMIIYEDAELIVEILTDGGADLNTLIFDGSDFHILGKLNFVEPNPSGAPPTVGKDLTVQGNTFLWFHENAEVYISDDLYMQGSANIIADACVDVTDDMYIDGTTSKLCGSSNISIGKFSISNSVITSNGAGSNQICINSNVKRDNNFGPCGPDAMPGSNNFNPVAYNDVATVDQGVTISIDVLDQGTPDNDLLNDPLEIVFAGKDFLVGGNTLKSGTVVINTNGTPGNFADDFIDYTSAGWYAGKDTFWYTISDGNGSYSKAMVEVTVNGTLLPVELSDFRARDKSCTIELEWVTQSEVDNHFFEIEKSEDGKEFKVIGRVEGVGNSNTPSQYSFVDKLPNFSNYYRLKQWDLNGEFSYSQKIYVESICIDDNSNIGIVKAFPNPMMQDNLAIRFDALDDANTNVTISDLFGRHIFSTPIEIQRGMNHIEINLSMLQAGTYFLRVDKKTTKFVKQTD